MPKVFSNSMVAHTWANQRQQEGRSHNGNFSFTGALLYSYSTVIAALTNAELDGKRIALVSSETFSMTTSSKHMPPLRRALHGLNVETFYVPYVRDVVGAEWQHAEAHKRNVEHFAQGLRDYATRAAKPFVQLYSAGDTADSRVEYMRNDLAYGLFAYSRAFDVPNGPHVDLLDSLEQIIRAGFAKYNDPKRIASRERSNARREVTVARVMARAYGYLEGVLPSFPKSGLDKSTKRACESKARNDAWALRDRNANRGQITEAQWLEGARGPFYSDKTLVRRIGDKLETSRGAECPFAHAVIAFRKAQECRATGTSWHRNGQQIRVGVFSVDSIDELGNMRAGCHTLQWEEMLRLALQEVPHLVKASFGLPALLVA
ncbi:MAG: hypothetical protein ACXWNL_16160 [Vulcanimicrobiaceae bacterium]